MNEGIRALSAVEEVPVPSDMFDLNNLRVVFPGHIPCGYADSLVTVAHEVLNGLRTWRDGCNHLSANYKIPLYASSAFFLQLSNQTSKKGHLPDRARIKRAAGAHVDESMSFDALRAVIEVEYAFPSDLAAAWACCLAAWVLRRAELDKTRAESKNTHLEE